MRHISTRQTGDLVNGRYRIVRLIGEGGMGRVFEAEDLRLPGKRWAIKETTPMLGDSADFLREAQLLAGLQHPLLPQIVDYEAPSVPGGSYIVVMEFVPGMTLESVMQQSRRALREESVVSIGMQLCSVLTYLHNQPEPIVFRDIKPGNIMIDEHGRIKLIDFGIARRFKPDRTADTVPLGTVGFASPEQLRGEQTDPRSDLYSLGAVLYYLLSGGQYAAMTGKPLAVLRSDLNPSLLGTVDRLLAAEPADRPQHAAQVMDMLRQAGRRKPLETVALYGGADRPERRPLTKVIVVGGLYAGAGATFASFALSHALEDAHVRHAVAEFPPFGSDHYALLDGERKAPRGYRFLSELLLAGDRRQAAEWRSGYTTYLPSHPTLSCESWNEELTGEWMSLFQNSVVIVDIGHHWRQRSLAPLLARADERIVVVDPSPGKLQRSEVRAVLQQLDEQGKSGAAITWLANRDARSARRSEWLDMLPGKASVSLPSFDTRCMLEAQWGGSAIPLERKDRKLIASAFTGWIEKKSLVKTG
ncbi:serine/threonine protein kinase [Paenibacillus chartarius]|uniref:Serine/threonine protein kinase n=1 Tax=Paenibacillus chartarius TaxID=747481 RepID=A0ABV6DPV8_9BACL